jgi:hypothetical protein
MCQGIGRTVREPEARRRREVIRAENLYAAEITALAASEPPSESAAFDDEVPDAAE